MKFKKSITYFELTIIILSTIALSYIIDESEKATESLIPLVSAEESQIGCCAKTINQEYCSDTIKTQCPSIELFTQGVSCSVSSFCKKGCCYDEEQGIFDDNVLKRNCDSTWAEGACSNIASAEKGCCILGDSVNFLTQGQCNIFSQAQGIETKWDNQKDELSCLLVPSLEKYGACVLENQNCKFTTLEKCIQISDSTTNFHQDILCTAPDLNTNCQKTQITTCVDGKDEVYFTDSCGNTANIYDSDKYENENYWTNIIKPESSCNPNTGSPKSESCGNCNRILGGMCSSAYEDKFNPDMGSYYCKPTSCEYDDKTYKNGESWCVYEGQVGDGKDLPGTRHYQYICNQGSVDIVPCADKRNQICVESDTKDKDNEVVFKQASCVTNTAEKCILINSEEGITQEQLKEKCTQEPYCQLVHIGDGNPKNVNFNYCAPTNPIGFGFKEEQQINAESTCSQYNMNITKVIKKSWFSKSCKQNCDAESSSIIEQMAAMCSNMGDCGPSVNIEGDYTENFKTTGTANKIRDSYINLLKGFKNYNDKPINYDNKTEKYLIDAGILNPNAESDTGTSPMIGIEIAATAFALSKIKITTDAFGLTWTKFSILKSSAGPFAGAFIGAAIGFAIGSWIAKSFGVSKGEAMIMSLTSTVGGGLAGWNFIGFYFVEGFQFSVVFGIVIPLVLLVLTVLLGGIFGKMKTQLITFTCESWKPPTGTENCDKCAGEGIACTEYKCNSLGAGCEFVSNKGDEDFCDAAIDDGKFPQISANETLLNSLSEYIDTAKLNINPNLKYVESENSLSISSGNQECLQAYENIPIMISTDEKAVCVADTEMKSFAEMSFPFSPSSYTLNHAFSLQLPDPSHGESQGIDFNDKYVLYVKCQDRFGHETPEYYAINMCVNEGEDKTAPRIIATTPVNNSYIGFDATSQNIQIITNELATCKWDYIGTEYNNMQNNLECNDEFLTPSNTQGYVCTATLPINSKENKFFINCKDQPWLEETEGASKRNAKQIGDAYILKKAENKIEISSITPNQDILINTDSTTRDLIVKTNEGVGEHICSYSLQGFDSNLIEMWNTNSKNHEQPGVNFYPGEQTIYVECKDETGDTAQATSKFEIIKKTTSPSIARVWQEGSTIKINTVEESECRYSIENCNFVFDSGNLLSGDQISHRIQAVKGLKYYIKCKDELGNTPSSCSLTITAI